MIPRTSVSGHGSEDLRSQGRQPIKKYESVTAQVPLVKIFESFQSQQRWQSKQTETDPEHLE